MNDREALGSKRRERNALRRYAPLLLVLIAGIAIGSVFREPTLHLLGRHEHSDVKPTDNKRQLWTCGMHPQVIRDEPGLCPICHMKLTPLEVNDATGAAARGDVKREVKYWWDPMIGPASISDKPGKSSMGMDLVPVYEGEDPSRAGTAVSINPVVVQNMGVRVVEAMSGPILRTVRAVGYLDEAQPNIRDVNLRVSGWIEKLYAHTVGMHLKKGDKLFELYSPEVQVAVGELVAARKATAITVGADELARRTAGALLDSARRKLELWGLDEREVERLATAEKAPRTVTFRSPITGHLIEKPIVEGSAVKAGDRAMRIVDHSTLWLDSQVYEQDLPFIRLGQKVRATVEGSPGKELEGEVVFVHPHVDPMTRTAAVRITIPNPGLSLRPGMYATAEIRAELSESALLVPREAVIDTGTRQVAFVVAGAGRFEPRNVKTGVPSAGGMIEILEGLRQGEQVVTSGQFLLDSESRMREAIQKHLDDRLLANQGERGKRPAGGAKGRETRSEPSTRGTSNGETTSTHAETLGWSPDVDAVFAQYLEMAEVLGAEEPPDRPLDVDELVAAAQALVDVTPPDQQAHAMSVLTAASALDGKPFDEQRSLFTALSEAVLSMAEVCPPSKAIAEKLYIMYCPMKDARWIQITEEVANPYYVTEMKRCGEVQRTIDAVSVE